MSYPFRGHVAFSRHISSGLWQFLPPFHDLGCRGEWCQDPAACPPVWAHLMVFSWWGWVTGFWNEHCRCKWPFLSLTSQQGTHTTSTWQGRHCEPMSLGQGGVCQFSPPQSHCFPFSPLWSRNESLGQVCPPAVDWDWLYPWDKGIPTWIFLNSPTRRIC